MSFVVRPADNASVEAVVREHRELLGNRVINKKSAVKGCLTVLRGGGTAGILIDQYVPEFERRADAVSRPKTCSAPALSLLSLLEREP